MELEERQQLAGGGYRNEQQEPCIKWRYIFAILGSMGMAIIYGLKVNLSVAIVAMVNHTAVAAMTDEKAGHEHDVQKKQQYNS